MTTRQELEKMTKSRLLKMAFERFGKRFSRRNNKPTLINSILQLEGQDVEGTLADPAAAGKASRSSPAGTVSVTITDCPDSTGVHMNVNGRQFDLPLNQPKNVPGWILPSLRNAMGVHFTVE